MALEGSTTHSNHSILSPFYGESLPPERSLDKLSPSSKTNESQTPTSMGTSLPAKMKLDPIDDIMDGLDKDSYNKEQMERIFQALKNFQVQNTIRKVDGTHNKDGLIDELTDRQIFLMQLIDMVCKPNRIDAEYRSGRDYQSTRLIGEGGFGIVRFCLDNSTGATFAEKQIRKEKYKASETIVHKKLTTDMRLMMQEDSEEITCAVVLMLGAIQQGEIIYLYMEYMEDGSLADMLKNADGPLTFGYIIWYFHQILEGLAFIHSRRILHLDIKADNILIKNEDYMKIADFGLAREIPDRNDAIYQGFCGTPHFMAPEVIREELMSPKSDVWSVGCVLYELITKKVPWIGKDIQAIYYTVGRGTREVINKFVIPPEDRLLELAEDFKESYETDNEVIPMMLDLFDQCFQLDFKNRSSISDLVDSEIIRILFTVPDAFEGENEEVPSPENLVPDSEDAVDFPPNQINSPIVHTHEDLIPSLNITSLSDNSISNSFVGREYPSIQPENSIPFISSERPRSLTHTQIQADTLVPDSVDSIKQRPSSLTFS